MVSDLEARGLEWFIEQLDAAEETINSYKCWYCQIASSVSLVLVIDMDDPDGTRVLMVGVCGTCGGESL